MTVVFNQNGFDNPSIDLISQACYLFNVNNIFKANKYYRGYNFSVAALLGQPEKAREHFVYRPWSMVIPRQ